MTITKNKEMLTNGNQLIVSHAQVEDAEEIISFLNQVGGETDYLTFGLNEFSLTVEEEKKTISTCLSEDHCLMLVGKVDNKIVSHLYLSRHQKERLAHLAEISVTVKQSYWGYSIGSKMVKEAILWARAHQISKLELYVRTDNHAAIHLYKKVGFVIEGQITRAIKINGNYYENYIMGLSL